MGINPCPLSSPTTPNGGQQLGINSGSPDGGQQMGINPCPYTMGDDKWESTHVYQTYFIESMRPQNKWAKDGTRLTKPIDAGLT